MNSVRLISVTPDAEKLMSYCARVSNPANQENPNYAKLLKYCIDNGHFSVFEQAFMTIEIQTTRGLAAQILRHRSFTFQEFCMSGDTEVFFDLPNAIAKNKRQKYSLSLKHLYNNWKKNKWNRERIKKMYVRVFDSDTNLLTHAHIKEVFQTGIKDIFEITLENGKIIRSTKEHKVLTQKGFQSLEDCLGLKLVKNTATIHNNVFIGCNGTPIYQNYDWLLKHKEKNIKNGLGLHGIANDARVSIHTIRKWLKKNNLCFSKKEVASYTKIWNKGIFGYTTGFRSAETRKKMSQSAKKGKDSNLWKDGTSSQRAIIQADIAKHRQELMRKYEYCCGLCNKKIDGIVHLHHIVPVSEDLSLAREYNNLMPVHPHCHMSHHKLAGHCKTWREKSIGNTMTVSWSKIKKVKYLGKQMTYDLEIDHKSHNYVANGVIVHNSQRYADTTLLADEIPEFELRRQDTKNRQNSIDDISDEIKSKWGYKIREHFAKAKMIYDGMIKDGVAKECARFVLPLATPTKLYMSGSVRSFIHWIQLRSANGTQKEHMIIANEAKEIFKSQFPITAEALGWTHE